jgi:Ca2+-binding RTX toxin-like protein
MSRILRQPAGGLILAGAVMALAVPAVAATVNGTAGDDVLRGTANADVIRGFAGDDLVTARGGNDDVRSGRGDDVVQLGGGADRLTNPPHTAGGRDIVQGGPGPDVVIDAYAADLGDGNDRYHASTGGCLAIDLGAGDDRAPGSVGDYYGGRDDCVLRGGEGDDTLAWPGYDGPPGPRQTVLSGGPGADTLRGGYNDDVLLGGAGDDVIDAAEDLWARPDIIVAGPGDDEISTDWEGNGSPIDCGNGTDTVRGVGPSRILIDCEIVNP